MESSVQTVKKVSFRKNKASPQGEGFGRCRARSFFDTLNGGFQKWNPPNLIYPSIFSWTVTSPESPREKYARMISSATTAKVEP